MAVLMIDQSAAFDVCNHTILEAKLELEEEQNSTAQWFHSYLSDRSQCSKVEGKVSSVLNIPACSVIQGGCRSGLLYTILTCDLPDIIHQHIIKEPARYCVEDGDMATFVDDSTSYYGNKDPKIVREVTQKNFNSIEDYMTSNKTQKLWGQKSPTSSYKGRRPRRWCGCSKKKGSSDTASGGKQSCLNRMRHY